MNFEKLLEEIKLKVTGIFLNPEVQQLPYHNLNHTLQVVTRAIKIAKHYKLNKTEFFIVVTAAWFHDVGYYNGPVAQHEERGAILASEFLSSRDVSKDIIEQVRSCILATNMPQQPQNLLEQIVCDADLYHFGQSIFPGINNKMRKETEMRQGNKIDKGLWVANTINLLQSHQFQTGYAKNLLANYKANNLQKLIEKEQKQDKEKK